MAKRGLVPAKISYGNLETMSRLKEKATASTVAERTSPIAGRVATGSHTLVVRFLTSPDGQPGGYWLAMHGV
jgi:hypothetical protein